MISHQELSWPAGDPADLRATASNLDRHAQSLVAGSQRWERESTTPWWSGTASFRRANLIRVLGQHGRDSTRPLHESAVELRRIALYLEDSQAAVLELDRVLTSHDDHVRDRTVQSARARQYAVAMREIAGIDPSRGAEAARADQAAQAAHRRHTDASNESAMARQDGRRRSATIVADLQRLDKTAAAHIRTMLATRPHLALTGATTDTALYSGEPSTSDAQYEATRLAVTQYINALTVAINALTSSDQELSWTEHIALGALLRQLEIHTPFASTDRNLLAWSPEGDGQVVEVFGNLDTAEHIAVMVPGITNTVANFDDALSSNSKALWLEASEIDQEVAVIAWLGYDTPGILDSVSKATARDWQDDLRSFVASFDSEAHVTLVAHSYGSVLAGEAALNGLAVDELVLVGSPGTSLDHATDARLEPDAQVWAAVSDTDFIVGRASWGSIACPETVLGLGWLETLRHVTNPVTNFLDSCETDEDGDVLGVSHGRNPAHENFGAIELSTEGVGGHSSYFDADATSLIEVAEVVTEVHPQSG